MNIIESQYREFKTREHKIDFDALKEPFHPDEIEWRVQTVSNRNKPSCLLIPYITNRAIMNRLDEVVGSENWWSEYHPSQGGDGIECRLSIRVGDRVVTKRDAAPPTRIESIKGGYSDSMKRAAVHWGIGRYLYYMDSKWQPILEGYGNNQPRVIQVREHNKHIGHCVPPYLPDHFLPKGFKYFSDHVDTDPVESHPEPIEPDPKLIETKQHDEDWDRDRVWFCASCKDYGGYKVVANWCESRWGSRPSSWKNSQRKNLLDALKSGKFTVDE